jgi:hypothetical protein
VFALEDEQDLDGFDYWIHFSPAGVQAPDRSCLDGLADLIARRLTLGGEDVVRLPNAELRGGKQVIYRVERDAKMPSTDRVVTSEKS